MLGVFQEDDSCYFDWQTVTQQYCIFKRSWGDGHFHDYAIILGNRPVGMTIKHLQLVIVREDDVATPV